MTRRPTSKLARRRFAQLALGGAAAAPLTRSEDAQAVPLENLRLYIPPVGAEEMTSACAFCIVGCGYRIYRWHVEDEPGGLSADQNALGWDFPLSGPSPWLSPNSHNVVEHEGRLHHVVVVPDKDAEVVNLNGDYSLGGVLARRLYSADDAAKHDRLLHPKLRIGDRLFDIDYDDAVEIVARLGNHAIREHGELAWGLKTYSYQFYENTYAITKLAFDAVGTPCWAPHDQPRTGSSTPGLSVAGIDAFSASYEDWRAADVVLLSGVAVYEARGVLFDNWVAAPPSAGGDTPLADNDKALVVINPRRDVAAQWAVDNGGVHLQLAPGTDTVLNNAIARVIIERGWADEEFIEQYTVGDEQLAEEQEANELRAAYGMTFAQWSEMILGDDRYSLAAAAETTGVAEEDIVRAASLLAEPREDANGELRRPRTSFMLEKGNYWSHNFPNSASFASLGLLVGAGNRRGRMISRGGGHQRGMMRAAPYPMDLSPDTLEGRPAGLDLDRWTIEGNLRMAWVIGCTWAGGGAASAGPLFDRIHQLTRETGPQLDMDTAFPGGLDGGLDVEAVIATLTARMDAQGMVLVQQDIYPQTLTEVADVVLPAASWGEGSFTRMQGERRLRHYAQICQPPGEARPDWRIVADVAQRMGFAEGFAWETAEEVFVEAAAVSGGTQAYGALVEYAQQEGRSPVEILKERGTTGLQCPLRLEGGVLEETVRFHDASTGDQGLFRTATGRALFARGDWDDVEDRQDKLAPRAEDGERWVINRRDSRTWSGMIEDVRIPYRRNQETAHVLEVSRDDATALGVVDGDTVRVVASDVPDPTQTLIRTREGSFTAVVEISDRVQAGVTCAYFNFPAAPADDGDDVTVRGPLHAANSVVSNEPDPINGMYSFKLGRGRIEKV